MSKSLSTVPQTNALVELSMILKNHYLGVVIGSYSLLHAALAVAFKRKDYFINSCMMIMVSVAVLAVEIPLRKYFEL